MIKRGSAPLAKTARGQSEGDQLVEHLFRHNYGRILSSLLREYGLGNLRSAEDAIQEAFLKALASWPLRVVPPNPAGWLQRVARNSMIDQLRALGRHCRIERALAPEEPSTIPESNAVFGGELEDDLLAMMFACCSPRLSESSQIVIVLKWLSGFSVKEIAKALLQNPDAVAQRLSRARLRLQKDQTALEVPTGAEINARLPAVQKVLYLIFNEGYASTDEDTLVRKELCGEAIRLLQSLLESSITAKPSSFALMALFCFHAARFDTRVGGANELLLLSEQDRKQWDKSFIRRGMQALSQSQAGEEISCYHLEAGIASCHVAAQSFEATDWKQITYLYKELYEMTKSPVVALNYATSVSYSEEVAAGEALIRRLLANETELVNYHLYWAVRADLLRRAGEPDSARDYYQRALELVTNRQERAFLQRRLLECSW